MTHLWGLIQSAEYRAEYERIPSKYRSQISRKTHELMSDPRPGGSRTALKGYDRLCRLRCGDYRVIYAYDDKVVQLMNLRRRDEQTYENLDDSELRQLEAFRVITGKSPKRMVPEWEIVTQKWEPAKPKAMEPLPQPITMEMLAKIGVPADFRPALLNVKSVDELLDCEAAPLECITQVLDWVCPKQIDNVSKQDTAVVALDDLIDPSAAEVCGPIDALENDEIQVEKLHTRSPDGKSGNSTKYGPAAGDRTLVPLVVISTRRNEPMRPYRGNTSRGIAKDSRYTVKLNGKVALLYYVGGKETALLTTADHPELVALVNEAKRSGGSVQGGGSFVINEYRDVLVPNSAGEAVLYAGRYTRDLEFTFDGALISPVAPSSIRPGDIWPGPHVGIRYTLAAGAKDVRYELTTDRGTQKTISLSDFHPKGAIARVLDMCRAVKPNGGALYVNEARELFAPVEDEAGYQRRYIGHLGNKPWFPAPD